MAQVVETLTPSLEGSPIADQDRVSVCTGSVPCVIWMVIWFVHAGARVWDEVVRGGRIVVHHSPPCVTCLAMTATVCDATVSTIPTTTMIAA